MIRLRMKPKLKELVGKHRKKVILITAFLVVPTAVNITVMAFHPRMRVGIVLVDNCHVNYARTAKEGFDHHHRYFAAKVIDDYRFDSKDVRLKGELLLTTDFYNEERTKELKEASARLEATTKQLIIAEKLASIGEITASIAHEINNPISVIQGNIEVIQQELGQVCEPLKTEFTLVEEQIHSIHILVSKLLQFARPEEYAGVIDYTHVNEVIHDTLPLIQHLLSKGHIELAMDLRADHVISMNRTELQQVLINLIVNAIHAMPNGGDLRIKTEHHKRQGIEGILITVSDTGTGISKEVIKRVFDPFFTTKAKEGTGLGLSISQKLVVRSGGNIQVESKAGGGTKFSVFFASASP